MATMKDLAMRIANKTSQYTNLNEAIGTNASNIASNVSRLENIDSEIAELYDKANALRDIKPFNNTQSYSVGDIIENDGLYKVIKAVPENSQLEITNEEYFVHLTSDGSDNPEFSACTKAVKDCMKISRKLGFDVYTQGETEYPIVVKKEGYFLNDDGFRVHGGYKVDMNGILTGFSTKGDISSEYSDGIKSYRGDSSNYIKTDWSPAKSVEAISNTGKAFLYGDSDFKPLEFQIKFKLKNPPAVQVQDTGSLRSRWVIPIIDSGWYGGHTYSQPRQQEVEAMSVDTLLPAEVSEKVANGEVSEAYKLQSPHTMLQMAVELSVDNKNYDPNKNGQFNVQFVGHMLNGGLKIDKSYRNVINCDTGVWYTYKCKLTSNRFVQKNATTYYVYYTFVHELYREDVLVNSSTTSMNGTDTASGKAWNIYYYTNNAILFRNAGNDMAAKNDHLGDPAYHPLDAVDLANTFIKVSNTADMISNWNER